MKDCSTFRISSGDFSDSRVLDLIALHHTTAHAASPPGSAHALDIAGLQTPDIHFWALWDGETLLGIGALKRLAPHHGLGHGEVKSMHTAEMARRRGIAAAMLKHIIASARADGLTRLSLETGAQDYFAPSRALYRRHGFVECAAYADYVQDPNSVFMMLDLKAI
jgi:putative acetyltransferase